MEVWCLIFLHESRKFWRVKRFLTIQENLVRSRKFRHQMLRFIIRQDFLDFIRFYWAFLDSSRISWDWKIFFTCQENCTRWAGPYLFDTLFRQLIPQLWAKFPLAWISFFPNENIFMEKLVPEVMFCLCCKDDIWMKRLGLSLLFLVNCIPN